MTILYMQLLPTVFVRADAFPNLQAFQATQRGLKNVFDPAPGLSANDWDDEPTRPDRVLPADLRRQLQADRSEASLPAHIERELADRFEVEHQEMRRLKGWMERRRLRVSHFTKAAEYLVQMRRDTFQEGFDNEPTVKIDVRDLDRRRREARQGLAQEI
jgi:hypothetical protein